MAKASSKDNKKQDDKKNQQEKEPDQKFKTRAEEYLKDTEKAEDLLKKAQAKMADKKSGPLKEVLESLAGLCRLVKRYVQGEYRETPWHSLVMMVAAIVYFVSPIDAILDAIPVLGFVDDAGVLAWTAKTFKDDIDAFIAWEVEQNTTMN
ncbi:MAG TPA: YkvA family protein [Noviherbaspirillum sp.]|nr:YkvA family protein [Noviherbaspirillum sp.]